MVTGEYVAFFLFALMAISGGVLMLNLTKVIHMVLSIGLAFFGVAGLFVILQAEYLAFVQILIYAGAITIMMAMGTMMTHQQSNETGVKKRPWHTFFATLASLALGAFLLYGIYTTNWNTGYIFISENNVLEIGLTLFSRYVIPFEVASILLLVALVGAIVLAKKESDE